MNKTASLILKTAVVVCSFTGVILGLIPNGESGPNFNTLLFFTTQSNIWIGLVCLAGAIRMLQGKRPTHTASVLKMMFTVAILLTGVVFNTMLAPIYGPSSYSLSSILVHVVSPAAAVLDYFVCRRSYRLNARDAWWGIVPPLYYLGFASAGYVLQWNFGGGVHYPYFFLNWGSPAGAFGFIPEFPFIGVAWYIAILLLALLLVSKLFVKAAQVEYV